MNLNFFLTVCSISVLLSGCASKQSTNSLESNQTESSSDSDSIEEEGDNDLFEPMNRLFFGLNKVFDTALLKPIATVYSRCLPQPVQTGVHNVTSNFYEPLNFFNYILQGNLVQAGGTVGRFIINSTVGLFGLIDFASKAGIENRETSFGETLAVWGGASGPYVIIPLLGPSSVRGTVGCLVDFFINPWFYLAKTDIITKHHVRNRNIMYGIILMELIDRRAGYLTLGDDLEKTSIDLYASLRSIAQQREQFKGDEARRLAKESHSKPCPEVTND